MKCIPVAVLAAAVSFAVRADPGIYNIERAILWDTSSPNGYWDSANPFAASVSGTQTFDGSGHNQINGSFCINATETCFPVNVDYLVQSKDAGNQFWSGLDLVNGLPVTGSNLSWNPVSQTFQILYTFNSVTFFSPVPPEIIPEGIVIFQAEFRRIAPLPQEQEAEPREPMQILSFDLAPAVDWRDVDLWDIIEPRAGRQISGLIF